MLDIHQLSSIEQMILDELRDLRKTITGETEKPEQNLNNAILDEINQKLDRLESLVETGSLKHEERT
ncbi:MAG: hypothetical protein OXI63_13800 [Candidatus Poribacteria bacterium]|nr:hypothetical protein [Candidatus Poribacteria bacterium]